MNRNKMLFAISASALFLSSLIVLATHIDRSGEPTNIDLYGAFTEEQLDKFCRSQGFQHGYHSWKKDYNCYKDLDNQTTITKTYPQSRIEDQIYGDSE